MHSRKMHQTDDHRSQHLFPSLLSIYPPPTVLFSDIARLPSPTSVDREVTRDRRRGKSGERKVAKRNERTSEEEAKGKDLLLLVKFFSRPLLLNCEMDANLF